MTSQDTETYHTLIPKMLKLPRSSILTSCHSDHNFKLCRFTHDTLADSRGLACTNSADAN